MTCMLLEKFPRLLLFCGLLLLLGGCGLSSLGTNLTTSLLNQKDPELVRAGLPAYLLTIDGLIANYPKNANLLRAGANLHAFYAASFTEAPQRSRLLSEQAFAYAERALCVEERDSCQLRSQSVETMTAVLARQDVAELPSLMTYGIGWLVWVKNHTDDWGALADLPKIEVLLNRMLAIDEGYAHGTIHLYLGVLESLRPEALGGDPASGRRHFERAVELSGGRDLSFKVEFAASYARTVYDRELHDRLLQEVLAADPEAPGLTLMNVLARQRAAALLASADDYF